MAIALLIAAAGLMYARWPRRQASESVGDRRQFTSDIGLTHDAEGLPVATADAELDSTAAARRLAELQAMADTATAERVAAPALLRAGLLKLRLHAVEMDSAAAARRPQDYFHNEIAGAWLYTGAELDSIGSRFPRSSLVDDAAYAKLFLVPGGECEGFVPCRVAFAVRRPVEFLQWYPESPHAVTVVGRINRDVAAALQEVEDLDWPTESYDVEETRDHLRHYDSVAKRLPSPARDSAATFLAALWERFRQRPAPQEFRAGEIPGEVQVACNLAEEIMRRALETEPRRQEGTFGDLYRGRTRDGCRLKTSSPSARLDSASFGAGDELRKAFERNRWVTDPRYDAAGPDGSITAMRLGFFLCIVDESSSGNGWDITLECFRDNTRPPLR